MDYWKMLGVSLFGPDMGNISKCGDHSVTDWWFFYFPTEEC